MTERTIARRYVRALFELSLEQGGADAVLADLSRLLDVLAKAPAQLSTLLDPRADAGAKRTVTDAALGAAAKPLTQDFCRMLIERKRERLLLLAAEEFAGLLREQRGEAVAEVTSAAALDALERTALQAKLAQLTQKKVALKESIDASLLSGVRVRVGSMLLDGSARRRLAGMRDELMKVALPKAPEAS